MSDGERTDEDRIIESLVIAGVNTVYQDYDFLPVRNSLYNIENFVPEYDEDVGPTIQYVLCCLFEVLCCLSLIIHRFL